MEFKRLKNILEAALLASSVPMPISRLSALFDMQENITNGKIGHALEALGEDCEGRGVELLEVASGFRYQVRLEVHDWVAKMWTERPSRYSRALLETLALIAYRQPVTRGEIESVRGVSVSTSIMKTMEEREWIRVVGHRDVPGRPSLFGTTREFLDYFNLKSLDELPSLAEIRELENFDPQLNLDNSGTPAHAAMPSAADGRHAEDQAPPSTDAPHIDESTDMHPSIGETPDADDAISTQTQPLTTADEAQADADGKNAAAETDTEETRA